MLQKGAEPARLCVEPDPGGNPFEIACGLIVPHKPLGMNSPGGRSDQSRTVPVVGRDDWWPAIFLRRGGREGGFGILRHEQARDPSEFQSRRSHLPLGKGPVKSGSKTPSIA